MSRSEAACVSTISLALLVTAAASGAPMRTDLDQSVMERHRALGQLYEPSDQDLWLGDLRVRVDPTAIRRHRALGRLPEGATANASQARASGEKSAFDWGDGAIGFGVGVGTLGVAIVLAGRVWGRSAAAWR
jgi:hypothetical protein